jgi:hypothetical protein
MKWGIEFLAPISAFASDAKPAGTTSHGSRFPILPEPDPDRPRWENRRYTRTRMIAMTWIQESGRDHEIVGVSDISRGGVSLRGGGTYQVHSWIQFAVP